MKKIDTNYKPYLPNIRPLGVNYFITIRLKDALPHDIIHQLEAEFTQKKNDIIEEHPDDHQALLHEEVKRFFAKYDQLLDRNPRGACYLKHCDVQRLVKDQLYDMNGRYFDLQAHCVMPNHIHFLIDIADQLEYLNLDPTQPESYQTFLNDTLEKLKGRAAYYSNQALRRRGNFWQQGSYQHHIQDDAEWCNIVNYIMLNPVRAGLARTSSEYEHCYYKYG